MTAFFPADPARRATEALARSALPGAPVRAPAPTGRRRPQPSRAEDPYAPWREAAAACADALRSWREAAPPDRPWAHAVYCVALDREESAALELVTAMRRRRRRRPISVIRSVIGVAACRR
jgi:hypothetical protein